MPNSPFPASPGLTPPVLRLVRYAMLGFVLLFGGFAYVQSQNRAPDDVTADLTMLRWVGYGLCVVAIVGMGVLRQVRERSEGSAVSTLGLVGSALAEAAAMFGAVYMVLGGDISIYALGLVLFLATWSVLPADTEGA
jgi:hypothetical protein